MRRLLLIVGIALLVALAGCAADDIDDDTDGDLADDVADADDDNGDDDAETASADDADTDDEPDRDTDDDPPPGDDADDADDAEPADEADDADDADDVEPADDADDAEPADDPDDSATADDDVEPDEPPGDLEIHHIDVGQADATLIVTPEGETILIDTGDWRQEGAEVIDYLEAHDIDRIDHLIATHAHADHIGGHDAVIHWAETEGEGIGAAYDSGVPHTTATYDRYLDTISEYDVELFTVEEGDELPLDNEVTATVLNPPAGDSGDDLHYNSITIVFEYDEFRYLTTGDAEADAEDRMTDAWADELAADVYQAGHHGSSTSSTHAFMDLVDPDYAIISSDHDSTYGHPHDEVLERFTNMGIETYWTGVHGDIVVTTDGETIEVSTSEDFSTDPADLQAAKPSDDEADDDENDEVTDETDDVDDADDPPPADETDATESIEVAELSVAGVSPDEEYIVLENTGDESIDLGEWEIRDREDGGQVAAGMDPFEFPASFELGPDEQVTIWTGEGENTDTDLYWDYGVNMWRADGDVIILINPDGDHVLEYAYGDQT